MNLRDNEQNLCSLKTMRITLQEKGLLLSDFGAQVYADFESDENSGCKSCRGQGIEEAPGDFVCRRIHLPARHIFTCTVIAQITQHRWHLHMAQVWVASPKCVIHPRVMFHLAPCSTLNTSTSSLSPISLVLLSSSSPNPDVLSTHPFIHCEDSREDSTSTEFHTSTGYEPKTIELNRILVKPQNQITDDQDDIEETGVKLLSYSQS